MVDSETSTSLPRLSRREVLSTLMAAAGGTALASTCATTVAAEASQDAAMTAWLAWHSASRRAFALCRKQQRLETKLVAMIGFPSVAIEDPALGNPTRIRTLQAFDDLASSVPSIRHLRDFVDAELSAHKARWDEADHKLGYSAALQEEAAAIACEQELADELFATGARSIPGIVAKIEALIALDAPSEDSDERPWPQLRLILADLSRLTQCDHERFSARAIEPA